MSEFDRTDPEFVNTVLNQAWDAGSRPIGFATDSPPESFAELVEQYYLSDDDPDEYGVSDEIEGFIRLIREAADPDEVVKRLPYDTLEPAGVWLVLPSPENLKKEFAK